jgi:hypothetical protein
MNTAFTKLNVDWNAEPNAPALRVTLSENAVILQFFLYLYLFPQFNEEDIGTLRFANCWRHRLGPTNDEGWYRGQCRFSRIAPKWGEFYEVTGDLLMNQSLNDWVVLATPQANTRHFLFYMRDETFECDAEAWFFAVTPNNQVDRGAPQAVLPSPSR